MKTKTYKLTVDVSRSQEYTMAEYEALKEKASHVFETPEEYADHVVILEVENEAGQKVMLGLN